MLNKHELKSLFINKDYNKIFENYIPTITNVCFRTNILKDDDMLQEAFMYAWEYITNYTDYNSDVSFAKRLYCTVYRHITYMQSQEYDHYYDLFDHISAGDYTDGGINQVILREVFKTISAKIQKKIQCNSSIIGNISETCLYIVLEHCLEGRSFRNLSKQFHVSVTTICSWYNRGIRNLRLICRDIL